MTQRILYYVPDNPNPSWGVGILYKHVELLNKNGFESYVLHSKKGFRIKWLKNNVPIQYLETLPLSKLTTSDVLVVPEVCVNIKGLKKCKARKILFIQNLGYTFNNLKTNENHIKLGFEQAFIIMPHMQHIVSKYIKLPIYQIPPFIDNSFFLDLNLKRSKKLLIWPKFSRNIDYSIVIKLLNEFLERNCLNKGLQPNKNKWKIIEMKGFNHDEVPKLMQSSQIYISLNTFEALNTSVVEALASGNFVFTYEAFGPKDYLRNNENAFVFPNNEPYQLLEKLEDFILDFENKSKEFDFIRKNAIKTAKQYTIDQTENELINFFKYKFIY